MRIGILPATVAAFFLSGAIALLGEEAPFPPGTEGETYYAPRIDLLALDIELDGELDDAAWARAAWQTDNDRGGVPEDDASFRWAAVADEEFLYVAVEVLDDTAQVALHGQCDGWQDDSIEVYIDAENDGPDCTTGTANCYEVDDAQITILRENAGKTDPNELVFGGQAGGPTCDFLGPALDVCRGIVSEGDDGPGGSWQFEVAIPFQTEGNNADGTPTWLVDSSPGCRIGWSIQGNDNDLGAGRDTKLLWALAEIAVGEQAYRNPGVFGKLIFVDPSKPLPIDPVTDVTCTREIDGTMAVSWKSPANAPAGGTIRILVDDSLVETLAGNATATTLTEAQVPRDDENHTIKIDNGGCPPGKCFVRQESFDECGAIAKWNLLGSYLGASAAPGLAGLQADYLTDGTVTEDDFLWLPGSTVATDFSLAASTGYDDGLGTPLPTVQAWEGQTGYVNFTEALKGQKTNAMVYAQCYVLNETGAPLEVSWADASDDSILVKLNGVEVWSRDLGRGGLTSCSDPAFPLDLSPDGFTYLDPLVLEPGENTLLVKVFQGDADWNFIGRFQDAGGAPVTQGIKISLAPKKLPVLDLTCVRALDGTVPLAWKNPPSENPAEPIRFEVDGLDIARTVPGDSTSIVLTAEEVPRDGRDHRVSVLNDSGYRTSCTVLRDPIEPPELQEPGGKLHINGGRLPVTDELGRNWVADATYLAVDQEPTSMGQVTSVVVDPSLLSDPKVPNGVLNSERWCDCTFRYAMRVPPDRYRVTLYFAETCTSCVGQSLGGTNATPGAARIFDVQVEDDLVAGYSPADAAVAPPDDGNGAIRIATELLFDVDVQDGRLDIKLVDLGSGNPPWNAALKGMAIERGGGPVGVRFQRGDVDASGGTNITDGIYILNYLFTGGQQPTCLDAADTDNASGLNITDGVYILNFLFTGGDPPPPPLAECGLEQPGDPTLGCVSFPPCQ